MIIKIMKRQSILINDPSLQKEADRLLSLASLCRNAAADFRNERRRNKDYTFGRQWNDTVVSDGVTMSEEEYIYSQGNIPLKNNLIRRLVRNVLGLFRARLREEMQSWTEEDLRLAETNRMTTLYARTMEEFLISGMAIHRKWIGRRNGVHGIWTDMVSPDAFFFDPAARDVRGSDLSVVGQIHEISSDRLAAAFSSSPEEYEILMERYKDYAKIRVFEIWHSEESLKRTGKHWQPEPVWHYAFVTESGEILSRGISPYIHRKHPFIFIAYPFLDGEIHSFVSDLIDQQRYTNRLITLYDWVIRASAKGVLLFPYDAIPDKGDIQEIADQWSRFNGVIVYKPKAGQPLPQQVSGNTMNIGIGELLDIQMRMMEDVSGVSGALQGRMESKSMSGTLYSQQTENSITSLRDILETFDGFISDSLTMERSLAEQCGAGK